MDKEHDFEKLRSYLEFRDIMLEVAEKGMNKYDPAQRGEEKTITQRAKELMESLSDKPYTEIKRGDVAQDIVLQAAYLDIRAGNTKKLEDDVLQQVITSDKRGYWLQMIAEKEPEVAKRIISEHSDEFAGRQGRIADLIAPEITLDENHLRDEYHKNVAKSKDMSTKEKEAFLQKAAEFVDSKIVRPAEEKAPAAEEYRRQKSKATSLNNQASAYADVAALLEELQKSYSVIAEKKDCIENSADFSKEAIENCLRNLPNTTGAYINPPDYKKLPVFLGRDGAKAKREVVDSAIASFNKKIGSFAEKYAKIYEKPESIEAVGHSIALKFVRDNFTGKMLDKSTITALGEKRRECEKESGDIIYALNEDKRYGYNYNPERVDQEIANAHEKRDAIDLRLNQVRERKEQLKQKAQEINAPEESKLQKVTKDMDKDTKARVRQENKDVKDVLAERAATR